MFHLTFWFLYLLFIKSIAKTNHQRKDSKQSMPRTSHEFSTSHRADSLYSNSSDSFNAMSTTNSNLAAYSNKQQQRSFANSPEYLIKHATSSTSIASNGRAKLAQENLQRLEKEKDDLYELWMFQHPRTPLIRSLHVPPYFVCFLCVFCSSVLHASFLIISFWYLCLYIYISEEKNLKLHTRFI